MASNLVILLVAMWSPIDFYIFTQPKFQSEKTCVQYVMEHHEALNIHIMHKYGGEKLVEEDGDDDVDQHDGGNEHV